MISKEEITDKVLEENNYLYDKVLENSHEGFSFSDIFPNSSKENALEVIKTYFDIKKVSKKISYEAEDITNLKEFSEKYLELGYTLDGDKAFNNNDQSDKKYFIPFLRNRGLDYEDKLDYLSKFISLVKKDQKLRNKSISISSVLPDMLHEISQIKSHKCINEKSINIYKSKLNAIFEQYTHKLDLSFKNNGKYFSQN